MEAETADTDDRIIKWIKTMKPETDWPKWFRIVRKKAISAWLKTIGNDDEYQCLISSTPSLPAADDTHVPGLEDAAGDDDADNYIIHPKKQRRTRKSPVGKSAVEKEKEQTQLATSNKESRNAEKARATARSRSLVHGKAAAERAGDVAAGKVGLSEKWAVSIKSSFRNIEFNRALQNSMRRSGATPNDAEPDNSSIEVDEIMRIVKTNRAEQGGGSSSDSGSTPHQFTNEQIMRELQSTISR